MEPTTILLKLMLSCLAISPFIVYVVIDDMAKNKKGAVRDKEGHIYAIEKGDENIGFIAAIDGWHLNDPDKPGYDARYPKWHMLPDTWGPPDELVSDWFENKNFSRYNEYDRCLCAVSDYNRMVERHRHDPYYRSRANDVQYFFKESSFIKELLGITIFGVPWVYTVRKFNNFSWNKWVISEEKPQGFIDTRNETVDSMIFQYQYPFPVSLMSGDTTKDKSEMVEVNITVLVTVQMFLPYNTLYLIKNWIGYLNSQVDGAVRDWASKKKIEELQEDEHNKDGSEFLNAIQLLNNSHRLPKQGLRIVDAVFQKIEIGNEEVRKAINKAYASVREKEAKKNEAEGEKAMINAVLEQANGEEERLQSWELLKMKEIAKSDLQVFNTGGGNTGTVVSLKEKPSKKGGKNV